MELYDKVEMGNRIRRIREYRGMNQIELATAAGVCVETFRKIERGKSSPMLDSIIRICDYLQIPIDYLLYGTGRVPEECAAWVMEGHELYAAWAALEANELANREHLQQQRQQLHKIVEEIIDFSKP